MKSITNLKHSYMRTLFVLLAVWLTATTAWADNITVTYDIGYTTNDWGYRTAFIKRADNASLKVTWEHGIKTLWPGNETHGVDDDYDITIRPSVGLDSHDYIFTTENNTSFTVTTASSNQYLIKSVVFKNGNNDAVVSSDNVNAKTTTVNVPTGKDIVHLTVTLTPYSDYFGETGTNEYTVRTYVGWNLFCEAVNGGNSYNGKTIKLDGDISVSTIAGASDHKFSGTFDGQGHTLTFNQGTSGSPYSSEYVAPFCYVNGATIQNLRTTGNIYTSKKYAGGIIANSVGNVTLTNCRSSMVINSSVSGDGTHGGLIANAESGTLSITGCLFDGKLCGNNTNKCGGFIGWRNSSVTTHTISNSVFDPAEVTVSLNESATFARNGIDTYNCYYTYLLNDGSHHKPSLANGNVSPKKYNNGQNAYRVTTNDHIVVVPNGNSTEYNVSGITAYAGDMIKYGTTYFVGPGETVTVGMEAGYATTTTPTVTGNGDTLTVSGSTGSPQAGPWTFTMPAANVFVSATTGFDPAHFSYDGVDTYTINSAFGWDMFCDFLQDNDTWDRFTGKTVKLGANIGTTDNPITRMAGSSYHDMKGTFDGQGYTLTVSYGSAQSPFNEDNAAPFRNAQDGCMIKNLHVAGNIYTSKKYAAGLVGTQYGAVSISNCRSSVTIHSYTSGDGTHGGLVGRNAGGSLDIEGCVFDGKLLTEGITATTSCGGFVGWHSTDRTFDIRNSIYAPAALVSGENQPTDNSATFARNWTMPAGSNNYYTRTLGDTQGQLMHSINPGDNTTITFDGIATEYYVSGITAYNQNENQNENINPGLKYGNTCYSANGNEVRLILDAEAGHYFSGYTTSPATSMTILDSQLSTFHCQLTMPNEDVTITGTPATEYNIVYDLDGGALPEGQSNRTTYNNQTPTFTLVNPTKQFYEFIGWTGTGLTEPTETVTIAQGSTGHRSYTAHWQALCPEPTGVGVTHVTQTTAKLNWTAGGSESSWDIFVTTNANVVLEYNTTPTVSNTGDKPYNLTDLKASTTYYVYVRARCDNNSLWSTPVVFKTLCNAVSLPYYEYFNSDELSICWTTHVYDHYNSSIDIRDNALSFRIGNNNIMVAVMPEMDERENLNAYQISFDAGYANFDNTYMTSGKISIGIMNDPNDLATFVEIKVVDITDEYPTYGRHTVRFNHYSGSGHYIAIRNNYTRNGYVLTDNISVTELPTCLEPTDLAVATNGYDATVTWESEVTDATYDVALSTIETNRPDTCIISTIFNTTEKTFSLPQTHIGDNYVYVRTQCGENNYSAWVGTRFVIGYCEPYIPSHDEDGIVRVRFGSGE